jgi:adenylate cyclase
VVRFHSSRPGDVRTVEVPRGTRLLEAVRRAGMPLARSCRGGGLCGRCGLRVLAGGEALPAPSPAEERAKARNRIPSELRLACQLELGGPLEVTASYW